MRRYVLLLLLSSILIGCGNDKKNEIKKVKIDNGLRIELIGIDSQYVLEV